MRDARDTNGSAPAWLCLLAGYLWAAALTATLSRGRVANEEKAMSVAAMHLSSQWSDAAARSGTEARARAEAELRSMSPRELRRLPGIGQARALAIARERWRSRTTPALATLERVPGIGPETARQAREWLEARGSAP